MQLAEERRQWRTVDRAAIKIPALFGLDFIGDQTTPRGVAFPRLWGWQMSYLYVIAAWAAMVAFLFPRLFGFR